MICVHAGAGRSSRSATGRNDMSTNLKLVVFVPLTHADAIRQALGEAGAGKIGNYQFCSFSSRGMGRFIPVEGAKPAIGQIGALESVEEERIEVVVPRSILLDVITAMKKAHPYDEVAYDLYSLESV